MEQRGPAHVNRARRARLAGRAASCPLWWDCSPWSFRSPSCRRPHRQLQPSRPGRYPRLESVFGGFEDGVDGEDGEDDVPGYRLLHHRPGQEGPMVPGDTPGNPFYASGVDSVDIDGSGTDQGDRPGTLTGLESQTAYPSTAAWARPRWPNYVRGDSIPSGPTRTIPTSPRSQMPYEGPTVHGRK